MYYRLAYIFLLLFFTPSLFFDCTSAKQPFPKLQAKAEETSKPIFNNKKQVGDSPSDEPEERNSKVIDPETIQVGKLRKGGPAHLAGLRTGDGIVQIGFETKPNMTRFLEGLRKKKTGKPIYVRFADEQSRKRKEAEVLIVQSDDSVEPSQFMNITRNQNLIQDTTLSASAEHSPLSSEVCLQSNPETFERASLGADLENYTVTTQELKSRSPLDSTPVSGAKIVSIRPGGPAEKAGLQPGDFIQRIDDEDGSTLEQVNQVLGYSQPDDIVEIEADVLRPIKPGSPKIYQRRHFEIELDQEPQGDGPGLQSVAALRLECVKTILGLELTEVKEPKSIKVGKLRKGWPADLAGLRTGDIILQVDSDRTPTTLGLLKIIQQRQDGAIFSVKHRGAQSKILRETWMSVKEGSDDQSVANIDFIKIPRVPNALSNRLLSTNRWGGSLLRSNVKNWCTEKALVDKFHSGPRTDENTRFVLYDITKHSLLENVVPVVREHCPNAKKIIITNYIKNRPDPVNKYVISNSDKTFTVMGIDGYPPAETLAQARAIARKHSSPCDLQASHPADPEKPQNLPGIPDSDLNAEKSIEACLTAVKANPDKRRFKFQLGRSLMLAGLRKEARDILEPLAESEYGTAQYYLAKLFEEGNGVPKDQERASILYNEAKSNRFDHVAVQQQAVKAPFDLSGYRNAELIRSVYNSGPNLFHFTQDKDLNSAYLIHMADTFQVVCQEDFALDQGDYKDLRKHFSAGKDPTSLRENTTFAKEVFKEMGKMVTGKRSSGHSLKTMQHVMEGATADAKLMIEREKCGGEKLKKFTLKIDDYLNTLMARE